MKLERGAFLKAAAMWLLLCAGCASAPKAKPEAPTPPTTAQAGSTTIVAVAPPAPACCPKQTLPGFLGLTGLFQGLGKGIDCLRNRLGMRFPGLEAKPPVLAITDPANAGPDAPPAVKAAADIKAEEDAAPQKIKALRYLATIGCAGCYPGVEEGMLAALDDCTEAVRYEAAKALRDTVGNPCKMCRKSACCSPKIRKKLDQIAHEMDNEGCYKEASARVRRMARVALCECGGSPAIVIRSTVPTEGPAAEPTPAPPPAATAAAARELTLADALSILKSGQPPAAALVPDERAIAAEVNGEPIFFSEITLRVEQRLAGDSSGEDAEASAADRRTALREELQHAIDRRLICQEARRYLPPSEFARVAYRREGYGTWTPPDPPLTAQDEERLADEWILRTIQVPNTCSRPELFAYYRANSQKYQEPARVRWEQATARFERFPSPEQAATAVTYLRGTFVHQPSQPPRNVNLDALEVRTVDWTRCTDLPRGVVVQTLATLPIGEVSPVLRDGSGLHVVRVLERTIPEAKSLDEVADAVRQDLLQARRERALQSYVQELHARARIRTVLDAAAAGAAISPPDPHLARRAATAAGASPWPPQTAASNAADCPCRR